MVKNIISKENIAQVEEVRELENTEQQQKPITETIKEAVLPVAHASDDEEKEGARQAIGYTLGGIDAINPAAGGVASGVTTIVGGIEEGIGKLTGNEGMAEGGKVVSQSALQPLKDLGKGIKNLFE